MAALRIADKLTVDVKGKVVCDAEEGEDIGLVKVFDFKKPAIHAYGHVLGDFRLHVFEFIAGVQIDGRQKAFALPVRRYGDGFELGFQAVQSVRQILNGFIKLKIPHAGKDLHHIGSVALVGQRGPTQLVRARIGDRVRAGRKLVLFKNRKGVVQSLVDFVIHSLPPFFDR